MNNNYINVKEIEKMKNVKKHIVINSKVRFHKHNIKKNKIPGITKLHTRPDNKFLITIPKETIKLNLPEKGSFNAGIVKDINSDNYIMVYRPDEYRFIGCILNKNFELISDSYFKFHIKNCADPRLIWFKNKLFMIYSSLDEKSRIECIRGNIIIDLSISNNFIISESFRISNNDSGRQKNWTPFIQNDKFYLIASVCPHIIYEMKFKKNGILILDDFNNVQIEKITEENWINPWMFKESLRGNTNPVKLEDGNYLNTFHTAIWHNGVCFYDNGCYVFKGEFPFNVIKCSNKTYLRAEDAVEPHFRKEKILRCNFPVGMIKEDNKIIISYGDNDSCVKIIKIDLKELENLMVEVY
jgi:predicted GH43/DUF377 family glycosyl hydrolase